MSAGSVSASAALAIAGAAAKRNEGVAVEIEHALEVEAMPAGHIIGAHSSCSWSAISSRSSSVSRASRSILLTKVMMGMSRMRQTSNSLRVCASMPLAASITITALSAAVSVR